MKREKKQTRVSTRKRRALKGMALAVLLVVLVNHIMHIGILLPRLSIHQLEERQGCGWTQVITREWVPEIHKIHIAYLTGNEEAVLLGSTYLTIYGWMAEFAISLDCSKESPIHVGESDLYRDENTVQYFFGRVDDPDITSVVISLQAEVWDEETQSGVRQEVQQIHVDTLVERNGFRYFLIRNEEIWDDDALGTRYPVIIGYDHTGQELVRQDILERISTIYG